MAVDMTKYLFALTDLGTVGSCEFIIEGCKSINIGFREMQRDVKLGRLAISEEKRQSLRETKAALLQVVAEIDATLDGSIAVKSHERLKAESKFLRLQHRARQSRL